MSCGSGWRKDGVKQGLESVTDTALHPRSTSHRLTLRPKSGALRDSVRGVVSLPRSTSVCASLPQSAPVYLSLRQSTSVCTSLPQSAPVYLRLRQSTPVYISLHQSTPVDLSLHQPRGTRISDQSHGPHSQHRLPALFSDLC